MMDQNELISAWKAEEEIAYIHGWDFSHVDGRYTEQDDLPWDYRTVMGQYLTPEMKILDIDTGGGEFLLSLNHPHENTAAMEKKGCHSMMAVSISRSLEVVKEMLESTFNLFEIALKCCS